MNREIIEQWLDKLKKYWFNKDSERAASLFKYTTFYQETPFVEPYTTFEEIENEWKNIQSQTIKNIDFKILAIDKMTIIVEWIFETDNAEFDGIYEIKFNDNLDCIYFKSWEMQK